MPEILHEPADKLPIVYKASRWQVWIVLAASVVFVAIGIYLIAEGSSQLIGTQGGYRGTIPSWIFGWMATLLGVIGALLSGVTALRDRPRIELRTEGIVIYPRFAAAYGWPWREVARIEVMRDTFTSPRNQAYEFIVLKIADGREEKFLAPTDVEEMRETMERVQKRVYARLES